jgi:hypothetical protein
MAQHPAIDKWARKKFNLPDKYTFRLEGGTAWEGYCETCRYEYSTVEVYAKQPGGTEYLHDTIHTDLANIMNEILDAAMETKVGVNDE